MATKKSSTSTDIAPVPVRKPFPARKCAYKSCGQMFVPSRKSQIYHRNECGDMARQERYWAKWRAIVKRVKAESRREREDSK